MIAGDDDSLQECQESEQLLCPYCLEYIKNDMGECCGEIGHGFNMKEFEEYFDECI